LAFEGFAIGALEVLEGFGADTADVLRELCGYPDDEIEDLARAGAFGSSDR